MGYYAHTERCEVTITKEKVPDILKAFEASPDDDIEDVFADHGFGVYRDHEKNICELYFEHEKYRGDDVAEFLEKIAQYVEPGSVLSFCGEDDCRWAFYFDGSTYSEWHGDTYFPGMPGENVCPFDGWRGVVYNLNLLFGEERTTQLPDEMIKQMMKHPDVDTNSLKAITDVLFDTITEKMNPIEAIPDSAFHELMAG